MDPITLGLGVIGMGFSLFGGLGSASVAKQQAQVSEQEATQEQNINVQKQQQAQAEMRRASLQGMRNAQQTRAQATAAATAQGAQFGSGLAGGLSGIKAQETTNQVGINQNFQTSQNIFGITSDINTLKEQNASLGGEAATYAGISSLGGALTKDAGTIGGLAKDAGSFFGGSLIPSGALSGGF